jgi:ABC-type branched-subunit amino acid transport system substrate-binding protein
MDDLKVRVGALVPLTSPGWVEAGEHLLAGLELGVEHVNLRGGLNGRPIELLVMDTAADPRRAVAAVEDLAATGAVALAGEYHSVVAQAVAARAVTLGLPFLCSSAVLDRLTETPTDLVARLAPPQSLGWRCYADYLAEAGHLRIAVAAQATVYWAAGTDILKERLASHGVDVIAFDLASISDAAICDELAASDVTALLVLAGFPSPAVSLVRTLRGDRRLSGLLIGAPAGQPEFSGWERLLGRDGAAIPFLRYLPKALTPLGEEVARALHRRLSGPPPFVAFEGFDTMLALADALKRGDMGNGAADFWSRVHVQGTRGEIRFSRMEGVPCWQWSDTPIEVVERDRDDGSPFRVTYRIDALAARVKDL